MWSVSGRDVLESLNAGVEPLGDLAVPRWFPKHVNYARTAWTSVAKIPRDGRGTRAGWLWNGWGSVT